MARGQASTIAVEGSQVPYNECYQPGIDLSLQFPKNGLWISGYRDTNNNLPIFECKSDPLRSNFLPIWSTHLELATLHVSFSNLIFQNIIVPIIGPKLKVIYTNISFSNALVISNSSSCEKLHLEFEQINITNDNFLFDVHFHPVKNVMGWTSDRGLVPAGLCLYCKEMWLNFRKAHLVSAFMSLVAYIRLQANMKDIMNSGASGHEANIMIVFGNMPDNKIYIERMESSDTQTNVKNFAVLKIMSTGYVRNWIDLKDSTFKNGSTAIDITIDMLGHTVIEDCLFLQNKASRKGGAIYVKFHITDGAVDINNCSFIENEVQATAEITGKNPDETISAGGAIYLESKQFNCSLAHWRNINIRKSHFKNNIAMAFGGSLYFGFGIFSHIESTTFEYDRTDFHAWAGEILSAKCRMDFEDVRILIGETDGKTSILDFIPTGDFGFVRPYNLYLECPKGHSLDLRILHQVSHLGLSDLKTVITNLVTFCRSCSEKEYTPEFGYAHLNYSNNAYFTIHNNVMANNISCLMCPYGGECNTGLLSARPNFWGYRKNKEYEFKRCPYGYCCNDGSVPCLSYDSCRLHRVGTLCGACGDGYSESILSPDCVEDSKCNDHWVWPITVLAALLYLFYYMYKSELVTVSVKVFTYLLTKCERKRVSDSDSDIKKASISFPDVTKITQTQSSNDFNMVEQLSPLQSSGKNKSYHQDNIENMSDDNVQDVTPLKRYKQAFRYKGQNKKDYNDRLQDLDKPGSLGNHEEDTEGGVDRGYLGIVTYYAQSSSLMRVPIEFKSITTTGLYDSIENYTVKYLDFDVYQVELRVCPLIGINALVKALMKTIFVITIYSCWCIMFVITYIICKCNTRNTRLGKYANKFRLKLIEGLVEVIKYSYSSLANNNFSLLSCVVVGSTYVWKYDGNVTCFTYWQGYAVLFLVFYTIPFSFTLACGTKLLKKGWISSASFVASCILPLPYCIIWLFNYLTKWRDMIIQSSVLKALHPETSKPKSLHSDTTQVILDCLQGPYREDDKTLIWYAKPAFTEGTQKNAKGFFTMSHIASAVYWEGIMEFRRLVLAFLSLVDNQILRLTLIALTCLVILTHHLVVKPFKLSQSNTAETLSLSFLLMSSAMNLVKATFSEFGMIPDGPNESLLSFLNKADHIMLFLLISFIVLIELYYFCQERYKRKVA